MDRPMPRSVRLAAGFLLFLASLWILLPVAAPLPEELLDVSGVVSTRVLDSEGRLLHEILSDEEERLHWVELSGISPYFLKTIIFKEDRRFRWHSGIDPLAVLRALVSNVRAGRVISGGSTITMQLARNISGGRPRTLGNKIREALLALRLERELTKDEILVQYVNRVPFGNQARGVERASQLYFHKPASNLSLAESAFLSVIPRSPSDLNPYRSVQQVTERGSGLLARMSRKGFISADEEIMAAAEPIRIREKQTPFRAPHLNQYLAHRDWGEEPSSITTTIDLGLQQEAEAALNTELSLLKDHQVHNGAVVVMENATGRILAFVGSRDFADDSILGQNNGCTSLRQPGSTLKPFTYALALSGGMTLADIVPDVEAHFQAATGNYSPRNFNNRFYGPMRIREALANSLNVSAVKVAQQVGSSRILEFLRGTGFESLREDAEYYGLGLTLGNGEVSLLELVAGYAALARGGMTVEPVFVTQVRDGTGQDLPLPAAAPPERVLQPEITFLVADVLSDMNARMASFGVLSPLNFPYRVAAKTGTSRNFTDNWTVGFTKKITVGVWVGNFDATPMAGISGITGAGPVFNRVMTAAMEGRDTEWFEAPEALARTEVCTLSGGLATEACPGTISEYFIEGTEPETPCAFHRSITIDSRNGLLAHNSTPDAHLQAVSFAVFPAPYNEWSRAEGVPTPPIEYSPLDAGEITLSAGRLALIYPDNGQTYIMDPTIPVRYQTILPRIDSDEPLAKVETILDGHVLGRSRVIDPVRIPISPGRHEVVIQDPVSGIRSKPVTIEVATAREKGYFW
ncbi:MAG: penicillin-binding protein 1C [bacterium]|nr:penicillin-binding protein 1C [bacterium]